MDGDPFTAGVWLGLGFAMGMNVFIVSYAFVKRLIRLVLSGSR